MTAEVRGNIGIDRGCDDFLSRGNPGEPGREACKCCKSPVCKADERACGFVLFSMDSNTTKARNIRAVLLTALYNAVNTMSIYYDNLYQYHMAEEMRGDERKKDV